MAAARPRPRRAGAGDLVNVGCSADVTIAELAALVQTAVGHRGPIVWDASKPDGTPRKLMDISRLTALGWRARIRGFAGNFDADTRPDWCGAPIRLLGFVLLRQLT